MPGSRRTKVRRRTSRGSQRRRSGSWCPGHPASAGSFLRSSLGGVISGTSACKYVVDAVISLVTRVLVYQPLALRHENLGCPRSRPGHRIFNGELILKRVEIDACEPFHQMQVRAGSLEERLAEEVCRVD